MMYKQIVLAQYYNLAYQLHIANNYIDILGSGWDWNQTSAKCT